jgi:hypothetical protein
MDKPNQKILSGWVQDGTRLCFTYNGGRQKYGILHNCYALGLYVVIDNPNLSIRKSKKVILLDALDSIVEVKEEVLV